MSRALRLRQRGREREREAQRNGWIDDDVDGLMASDLCKQAIIDFLEFFRKLYHCTLNLGLIINFHIMLCLNYTLNPKLLIS